MLTPRLPPITPVLAFVLLVASVGWSRAAVGQESKPSSVDVQKMPAIEFYLAKGDADACGPGCSTWIAAEGKFDAGAASRLRRLLAKLGRSRPPIYFHSPGGVVVAALEVGRLIREQKLAVSVAHTVPLGCDRDKPDKLCEAQKRSGEPIAAQFDPLVAMCNSACVYALAGGSVRHVPPGVKLGIHDVGLDAAKTPPRAAVRAAKAVTHERIEEYLHEMGIDEGLYKAALAVPFESPRALERDEVVRFGIDRREFDESPWQFIEKPAPAAIKKYFARTDNERVRYVDGLVSLYCRRGQEEVLVLTREHAVAEALIDLRSPSISVNGRRFLLNASNLSTGFDVRLALLSAGALDAENVTVELSAADLLRNEAAGGVALDMHGFSAAFAKLRASCDPSADQPIH